MPSVVSSKDIPAVNNAGKIRIATRGTPFPTEVAAIPNNSSVFGSYAPAENPKIAVAVIIPSAGHGGDAAAPAALDFYARYFGARIQDVSGGPDRSN